MLIGKTFLTGTFKNSLFFAIFATKFSVYNEN